MKISNTIPKTIKNTFLFLSNEDTKTKLIGLLTILILFWILFYFIPELFTTLFNTLLGNLILILTIIVVFTYNRNYGSILALSYIILYRFARIMKTNTNTNTNNTKIKEAFTWTRDSTQNFLTTQSTINRNTVFDINLIKENQASQEELDYFNKHKIWPWSKETIELYKEAINSNPYIRTLPDDSVNYARTIYNQSAILRIISSQTKEGQMLLNGVLVKDPNGNKMEELPSGFGEFPYTSGLIEDRTYDVIKCNIKTPTESTLERIKYTGKGGIYNEQTKTVTQVDYNDLEKIIPGFKFINEPCNPCTALNANTDYSCPFKLQVKDKTPFVSKIWQYLWNIQDPLQ